MRRATWKSWPGFTLIELLVVMAIIAVLASLLMPVLLTAREHTRRRVCVSNLRQIGMAIQMYAADYGGLTPPQPWGPGSGGSSDHVPCSFDGTDHMKDLFGIDYFVADVLMPYTGDRRIFVCPSEDREGIGRPDCANWSYGYCAPRSNLNTGPRTAPDYGDPARVWLGCDMWGSAWGCNHTRRTWATVFYLNVLYLDGHVRGINSPGLPDFTWSDPDSTRPPGWRRGRGGEGTSGDYIGR